MGASVGVSIHPEVIRSTEVSFVDKKTGYLFSEEEINKISDKACKEFNYHQSFYKAYKIDKNVKSPYSKYAADLANVNIK